MLKQAQSSKNTKPVGNIGGSAGNPCVVGLGKTNPKFVTNKYDLSLAHKNSVTNRGMCSANTTGGRPPLGLNRSSPLNEYAMPQSQIQNIDRGVLN